MSGVDAVVDRLTVRAHAAGAARAGRVIDAIAEAAGAALPDLQIERRIDRRIEREIHTLRLTGRGLGARTIEEPGLRMAEEWLR